MSRKALWKARWQHVSAEWWQPDQKRSQLFCRNHKLLTRSDPCKLGQELESQRQSGRRKNWEKREQCKKSQSKITSMATQAESFLLVSHVVCGGIILKHSFRVTKIVMTAGDKNGPGIIMSIPACAHIRRISKERWKYLRTQSLSKRENKQETLEWVPKELSVHLMCIYPAI